jgi:hypothetical protein
MSWEYLQSGRMFKLPHKIGRSWASNGNFDGTGSAGGLKASATTQTEGQAEESEQNSTVNSGLPADP